MSHGESLSRFSPFLKCLAVPGNDNKRLGMTLALHIERLLLHMAGLLVHAAASGGGVVVGDNIVL